VASSPSDWIGLERTLGGISSWYVMTPAAKEGDDQAGPGIHASLDKIKQFFL
jgi:hypothetical protein